ncbi:MAG: hypothetical protein DRG20_02200 [Deltaproteobacteria bacterium]|nr:MAG: hypothetical protein DRG20_02200 [Deltaproteobacteria bacterium]
MRLSKRFKIIKRIKNNIIYWGALFLVKVVSFIPVDTAVKIGKIGGRLAFYILKTERKRTLKNLYLAFGNEKNDKKIKIIARKVFENLGKNLFEVLSLGKGNKKILEMVELKEKDVVEKILKKKKGGFFITGHIGNWELMAAYLAMQGYKVNVMARSIYDERLNKLIVDFRSSYGINTLLRQTKRSAKEIIRILSNNEFLGVLIDQDVKKVEKVKVKFFGRDAYTPSGIAALCLKKDSEIIFGFIVRKEGIKHQIIIKEAKLPRLTGKMEKDIATLTQYFTSVIEDHIRKYPDQWVWMHKRWR